jgi:cyclase
MARVSAVALLAFSALVHAQGIEFDKVRIITQKLAPNVYSLQGSPGVDPGHPEAAGGRIGMLVGSEGVLLVDAQYAPLTDKVVAAIRQINSGPIRYLIDTHEHPDHTGGNPNFARMGAVIFAREETREALGQLPAPALVAAVGAAASFTDPDRLPVVTFGMGAPVKIHFDQETVDLIPMPASHTDGDVIVRFEHADVIMVGDFYRDYGYPFIDSSHGGWFKGVVNALDLVTALAGPNTQLVPGHGSVITRADLLPYGAMILDVRANVQRMIDEGKSLPEVLSKNLTAAYDSQVPGGRAPLPANIGTSADRFVGSMYAELKRAQP